MRYGDQVAKEPCDIPHETFSPESPDGPVTSDFFIARASRRLNRFKAYYYHGNETDPVHFPQVLTEARWEEEFHKFLDLELSRGE